MNGPLRTPSGTWAVIVANGSSVDAIPLRFWRECEKDASCLLVGTNRALCSTALQGVRFDALVMRDTYRQLWHKQEWGIKYHEELWKPCPCWKVGPSHTRTTHCTEFVRMVKGWQFDRNEDCNHEAAVIENASVVLMAANMAWHWGARRIYLVGVDYRGRHFKMLEPWESQSPGWEGQYDKPVQAVKERQFAEAVAAVESHGGALMNLSRGTRLKAVPLVDVLELIGD